jgi:DNA-binding NarL/FixJ family response regulator
MARIRVMIVDDEDDVRRGMNLYLGAQEHFEVVAEAATGHEALQICDETLPDVVLMDIRMPEMDGIIATKLIRQKHPTTQVIALTNLHDEEAINQMRSVGAAGYVLKDASVDELLDAIMSAGKASGVNILN